MPFVFRAYVRRAYDPRPPCSPSKPDPSLTPLSTPAPPPPRIFPAYKCPAFSTTAPECQADSATASDPMWPSDGRGYTDVVDSSSTSDEDDFDGGLNIRTFWNHTGAFPRFLSLVRAHALSTSRHAPLQDYALHQRRRTQQQRQHQQHQHDISLSLPPHGRTQRQYTTRSLARPRYALELGYSYRHLAASTAQCMD
jgi:hypothetical protein